MGTRGAHQGTAEEGADPEPVLVCMYVCTHHGRRDRWPGSGSQTDSRWMWARRGRVRGHIMACTRAEAEGETQRAGRGRRRLRTAAWSERRRRQMASVGPEIGERELPPTAARKGLCDSWGGVGVSCGRDKLGSGSGSGGDFSGHAAGRTPVGSSSSSSSRSQVAKLRLEKRRQSVGSMRWLCCDGPTIRVRPI